MSLHVVGAAVFLLNALVIVLAVWLVLGAAWVSNREAHIVLGTVVLCFWIAAVGSTRFSVFTPLFSGWFIAAVLFAYIGVFANFLSWWAALSSFRDAFSVALVVVERAALHSFWKALFSLVTAFVICITAAESYTSHVLVFAVEFSLITARNSSGPALSVTNNFILRAAERVGRWLTVVFKVGATCVILIFTAAYLLSILVQNFIFYTTESHFWT